jgi:hypothetical protein
MGLTPVQSLMAGSWLVSAKSEIWIFPLSINPEGPVILRSLERKLPVLSEVKALGGPTRQCKSVKSGIYAMKRVAALFSKLVKTSEWRDIETAPFDRELELAVIGADVGVLDGSCLRHGNGWLDAATLRPVLVTATHWRYRRPDILPMCCC